MKKVSRRKFVKDSALVMGSGLLASCAKRLETLENPELGGDPYLLNQPENILYSTCLQCHVDCQLKVKLYKGVAVKLDGNPYSPQNLLYHIPFETPPQKAAFVDGRLCPKGQAGIQTLYDPYRIRKVLKRTGPRGSNKWKTIPFDQFIKEVVEGGNLFKEIGENRVVPGFKDVYKLQDPKLSKALAEDTKKVQKKEMTVAEFKKKHANALSLLIDPDHPDLGPVNNQFVFLAGRIEHGRKELGKWFTKESLGSVNFFEHTTICEQSHHIAHNEMTRAWKDGKWGKGKHHLKPDLLNAEFVIFFGTGAFEANFGLTPMTEKVTDSLVERNFRMAVVDPRLSKTAAKAKWWVPIKPGTDAALALGMIRWIIEQKRYDARFLHNANKAAANADGEPSWTTASYLVEIDKEVPNKMLKSEDKFVVYKKGKAVPVDPNDETNAVEGDLFVNTEVNEKRVKSALQILKESAFSRSLEEWGEICGVDPATIVALAKEFTSHGKKAVAEFYRGPVQHTNGYYNAQALITLNLLVGNPDWKGGLSKGGGHWHESGGKEGSVFTMKDLHPGKLKAFGPPLSREKSKYEESTLFEGYPAKRPWYPFSGNVYQEVLPSAAEGYPYPIKILFLHKGTPVLSTPAGHKMIPVLQDTKKIPLFIASDVVIGESAMYADYILPDLTFLERWGTPHVPPDINTKTSKVRQPVVAPLTEEVMVHGESMPLYLEAFLIAVATKLGLSGFGKDGFGSGMDFTRPEDFYLKLVANMAYGDKKGKSVPDADDKEMAIFREARKHLPPSVFDEKKWIRAVGKEKWRKVVYVLNRGGRFEAWEKAYKGDTLAHKFGSMFLIYAEKVGSSRSSMTGKRFSGVAVYEPVKDASGKVVEDHEFPFLLITYKEAFGGHSRTHGNYWGQASLVPENFVYMNKQDATKLGIEDERRVRLISKSNPKGEIDLGNGRSIAVTGKVKAIEGIRPGVIAVSWHYGQWNWYGAHPSIEVNGQKIKADPRRGTGLVPNPLMRVDESFGKEGKVCLTDPIGASSSFYDTRVKIVV